MLQNFLDFSSVKNTDINLIKKYLIISEGLTDCYILDEIIKKIFNETNQIYEYQIINAESFDNIDDVIEIVSKCWKAKAKALLVVFDNDLKEDNNRFQAIQNILEKVGYPVPQKILEKKVNNDLSVILFSCPNSEDNGTIENIIIKSIKDEIMDDCVNYFFKCVSKHDPEIISYRHHNKAKLQVFWSAKNKYCSYSGIAAKKGWINFDDEAFKEMKISIKTFFNIS